MVRSAGLLLHRSGPAGTEVLLGHLGGPFWQSRDEHAWTVPKGIEEDGDPSPLATAEREFAEEFGSPAPLGPTTDLGEIRAGSKVNHLFARSGTVDAAQGVSNTFELEWPRGSGEMQRFPELDRFEWFTLAEARVKLTKGLQPFLDRLEALNRER